MTQIYRIKKIPEWYFIKIKERFGNPSGYEIKPYFYFKDNIKIFGCEILINGFLYDNSLQCEEVKNV